MSEALEVLNLDELLLQVGYGKIDADQVIDLLKEGPHAGEGGEAPPMRPGKIEQLVRKVTGVIRGHQGQRHRRRAGALRQVL